MTFGIIFEEFIFRGFLWGYLIRFGMTEWKLIVLQGIAFWFIHLGSITNPSAFFIVIPISTVLFSYLRKSSNSLFPPIIAHLLLNTLIVLATYKVF
jgi:membrane protease YdiL (CAAX protease family)